MRANAGSSRLPLGDDGPCLVVAVERALDRVGIGDALEVREQLLVGPVALLGPEEDPEPFADAATLEALDPVGGPGLLDDVGQFVGQEVASVRRGGRVPARVEHDVVAGGEGDGVDAPGGLGGAGVVVDPYRGEVDPEPRLHHRTGRVIERASATRHRPVDVGGSGVEHARIGARGGFALDRRGVAPRLDRRRGGEGRDGRPGRQDAPRRPQHHRDHLAPAERILGAHRQPVPADPGGRTRPRASSMLLSIDFVAAPLGSSGLGPIPMGPGSGWAGAGGGSAGLGRRGAE